MTVSELCRRLSHPLMGRRTMGFGVHSPFAYSLIKFTLTEKGVYRQFDELKRLDAKAFRRLALLFRLVCRFSPDEVGIIGASEEDFAKIAQTVTLADSRARVSSSTLAPVVIADTPTLFDASALPDESVIWLGNIRSADGKEMMRRIARSTDYGQIFSDGRQALFCRFKHLPRQQFNVFF